MTRSWHPSIPPALALLLTALMLVTGTAVAMESSAMAASGARTGNALSHCHHHTTDTTTNMTMNDMGMEMDHQADNHCPDDTACQCITLCQVNAVTLSGFPASNDLPAQHYASGPVIAVSPGIHQLPLRPPTLTV